MEAAGDCGFHAKTSSDRMRPGTRAFMVALRVHYR
jgi:hypothetical protein